MRLKCCGTQVLDCKGVYCSAHNAAVPSGIRDSESVGPGQTRIRPDHRRATEPAPRVAAVAGAGGAGGAVGGSAGVVAGPVGVIGIAGGLALAGVVAAVAAAAKGGGGGGGVGMVYKGA